jgi:hypothetical protein
MTGLIRRSNIQLLALTLIGLASGVSAQTVSFTVQSPTGPLFGGYVYVSPYTAQIGSGVPVPAICDDWADDVYLGQNWQAFETNLGSLTSAINTSLYFKGSDNATLGSLSQQVEYDAAAILSEGLLSLPGGPWSPSDTEKQDAYSFAIWELFDDSRGVYGGPANYLSLLGTAYSANQVASDAATLLANAISAAQTAVASGNQSAFSNVSIFTAACGTSPCTSSSRPQEFIVVNMPEPSSPALLCLYMLGFVGLGFVFRKRMRKPAIAQDSRIS